MTSEREALHPDPATAARAVLKIHEAEQVELTLAATARAARLLLAADTSLVALPDDGGHLAVSSARDGAVRPGRWLDHLLAAVASESELIQTSSPDAAMLPLGTAANSHLMAVPLPPPDAGLLAVVRGGLAPAFGPRDGELLQLLASHLALALRQRMLMEQVSLRSQQLEERSRQLAAFSRAVVDFSGELSLDRVLQQVVDASRQLIRARYAALGVANADNVVETFVHSGMGPESMAAALQMPRGHGLLGAIIREKRPIRIPDISRDPRSYGFPEGHPSMISFLGVPIVAAGKTLGNLYLTDKLDAPEFTAEDQRLAELVAVHAAVAIQNARLYEQVGRLVIVEERNRIGMDLHDGVIQSIYAVGLTLESARLALNDGQGSEVDRMLGDAIVALNDTIRDLRNFILDLRPHRFRGDLGEGISRLVREFEANAMVSVTLDADLALLREVRPPLARALFLSTQEGLANVARHARAQRAWITVERDAQHIRLRIADDGRGFDRSALSRTVGHGLSNMRTRADELRGDFTIKTAPGQGTELEMTLPLQE